MSAILTVRVAGPADLGEVDALLTRSYPVLLKADYPPSVTVTALPLISRANPRLVASGTYYLVERAGAIVGVGSWRRATPQGHDPTGRAHVRHVATDHRQTRQGIGRALMGRILQVVAASGRSAGRRRREAADRPAGSTDESAPSMQGEPLLEPHEPRAERREKKPMDAGTVRPADFRPGPAPQSRTWRGCAELRRPCRRAGFGRGTGAVVSGRLAVAFGAICRATGQKSAAVAGVRP